jgi:hypothetical protein
MPIAFSKLQTYVKRIVFKMKNTILAKNRVLLIQARFFLGLADKKGLSQRPEGTKYKKCYAFSLSVFVPLWLNLIFVKNCFLVLKGKPCCY